MQRDDDFMRLNDSRKVIAGHAMELRIAL